MSESFLSLSLLGWHDCPAVVFRLLLFCLLHCLLLLHLRLLLLLILLLLLLLSLSLLSVLLLVLHFGNHLVIDWLGWLLLNFLNLHLFNFLWLLFHFLLWLFLYINLLGFFNFFLLMILFFMILPVLVMTFVFPLLVMLPLLIFLMTLFSLLGLVFVIPLGLPELLGHIADSGPVLGMLLLLPAHFDEKSTVQNFAVIATPNKIDGINSRLKDNFERPLIVILNFDKSKLAKSFLNIFLNSIIVAFDQIESHILVLIIQTFDLVDQLLPLWKYESLLLCLFTALHPTITTLIILIKFNMEPNIYSTLPFLYIWPFGHAFDLFFRQDLNCTVLGFLY